MRLHLRHLAADDTLPAALWRVKSGLSYYLILTTGLLLAAAVPLFVMRILQLGGKSVGVLYREGERE